MGQTEEPFKMVDLTAVFQIWIKVNVCVPTTSGLDAPGGVDDTNPAERESTASSNVEDF